MQTVLRDLPGVQNYLDDITSVLQRLQDANLQINFDKSSFGQTSIPFLGHVISKEGLLPSPDHLAAMAEAPAPKDMAALRSFLGLISWLSKFLPSYATVVEPLRQLLQTGTQAELQWTDVTDNSFAKLKATLLESPALAIYDPTLPMFITTDASDYGLGAALIQLHSDDVERNVAFASRTLSAAERKYSTIEKEALACASDKTACTSPAPMQPVQFPPGPFQHVAVDIVGPFEHRTYDCRALKDSLQTANVTQQPWKPVVTDMLHGYRATAHATTGVSLFLLLRGRPMRTKLNILPPLEEKVQYEHVRVALQQAKSKRYTDAKRGTKTSKVTVGATVRQVSPVGDFVEQIGEHTDKFEVYAQRVQKYSEYEPCMLWVFAAVNKLNSSSSPVLTN
eukprot:superscaffoldBa00002705_g15056